MNKVSLATFQLYCNSALVFGLLYRFICHVLFLNEIQYIFLKALSSRAYKDPMKETGIVEPATPFE